MRLSALLEIMRSDGLPGCPSITNPSSLLVRVHPRSLLAEWILEVRILTGNDLLQNVLQHLGG